MNNDAREPVDGMTLYRPHEIPVELLPLFERLLADAAEDVEALMAARQRRTA